MNRWLLPFGKEQLKKLLFLYIIVDKHYIPMLLLRHRKEVSEMTELKKVQEMIAKKEQEWKELRSMAKADEWNTDRILEIKAEIAKAELKELMAKQEKLELEEVLEKLEKKAK